MNSTIRYLPADARRVLILANPAAGATSRQSLVDELKLRLEASGFSVDMIRNLDEVAQRVADVGETGIRAVVAAGGDGTIGAVVNRTAPDVPLTVLPLGTENLLAKYLDIAPDPTRITRMIAHGATAVLDAACANDQLFLLMAGVGFDGEVVRRLHAVRRGHIRHWSYVKPILDSIRRYKYPELRVYCRAADAEGDDRATEWPDEPTLAARWLFISNLPCYAGGLNFVPQAVGTDGQLDICAFKHGSFWGGLRYLMGVTRGRHLQWPDCHIQKTQQLRIESDDEVPYQIDGDPGGRLPLEITAVPGRMRLIVTESWALSHSFRHEHQN